jgi:phospholipid/cholesterol/gamma-HCH transport system permease protein
MANDTTANAPDLAIETTDAGVRFILLGDWTLIASRRLEEKAQEIVTLGRGAKSVTVNLLSVTRLDTAGAWLINRARQELTQAGVPVTLEKARPEHRLLLEEAHPGADRPPEPPNRSLIIDLLADLGRSIVTGFHQAYLGVAFLGEFMVAVAQIALRPASFRGTSLVYHVESIGFRSIPIIVLVNFLVGGIVAQQGIFQLQRFGASSYAVDLIGILVLRELGVLLTSIMIAGRSGSAITAEIGSMMMREEIDALRVMGLSPLEVLIAPRVLALVISLPMLTFLGDMSALFGGLLVTWSYGGVSPPAFFSLLQEAIGLNTFMVGLIKAPFMALVIGLIAAMDGLATRGSAESLGRQVTGSVVKSIFMVIVVDGFFAIFFAGIHY